MPATEAAGGPAEAAARAFEQEQLGRWEASARLYSQAFRGALMGGEVAQAADALRGQARVLVQEERFDEAEELAELSREIAERAGVAQAAARAVNILGIIRYRRRDWRGAAGYYGRALELALDVGDDELAGLALQNAGVIAYVTGDAREARSLYLEAIGAFVRSGNTGSALLAYNNLGVATADLREWMEADIYFQRGIELAERQSQAGMLAKLYANRAQPLIQIGEIAEARATLDRAEEMSRAVGDRLALSDVERWRARMERAEQRFTEAERHVANALELAAEPSLERAEALRELGALKSSLQQADEAREAYSAAHALYVSLGAEGLVREMEKVLGLIGNPLPEPE